MPMAWHGRAWVRESNELRLSSGDWTEERNDRGDLRQTCRSRVPPRLEWRATNYRPIDVRRRALYAFSDTRGPRLGAAATIRHIPLAFEPVVHPNGSFEVAFDAESVSLFFIDRDQQRSGFAERVHGDADVDVTMEPTTATYSGTLLDENAQPWRAVLWRCM